MVTKWVYSFEEGTKEMKELLGGKGAGLAEMTNIGIPVPPGFTITTETCAEYYNLGEKYPEALWPQVDEKLEELETKMEMTLGNPEKPLLVSVRSGAAVSMPGMMDTVLNLGLNDKSVQGLAKETDNERFAYDAYRRFINMFGDVVMGVEHIYFEEKLDKAKAAKGVENDTDLDTDDLKKICEEYKEVFKEHTGRLFPENPKEQLRMAIDAVFGSWNNKRAIAYRRINSITGLLGTAVNVQAMAFGNMGDTSGTGVMFTRNPSTGEKELYGECLINAQGEDVVAGIRTPMHITELHKYLPETYDHLIEISNLLESHYKDMQDLEFTIQESKLFLLQTRNGKRTAQAALEIAVDQLEEGLIDKKEAVKRIDPEQLDQLLHKRLDPIAKEKAEILAKGLPASPGAAVGKVVFTADKAKKLAQEGEKVILVRRETSPEDIEGMHAAQGILTSRGGMTSHAAVVARGMGKPCVAGCSDAVIDEAGNRCTIGGIEIKELEYITLDGGLGEIIKGQVPVVDPELSGNFSTLMQWADEFRKIKIKTNADTPHDAQVAKDFGAEGIGLCRTEHMFFEGGRIQAVREMILAEDLEGRKKALAKIEPMQKEDFKRLFKVMEGLPVIVRLLDPPLHEFLPKTDEEIQEMAKEMDKKRPEDIQKIKNIISNLHEFNPMLGFRGCRLGVNYPEITEMQARAILEAAIECKKEGVNTLPWIEVPLIGHVKEFLLQKKVVDKVADELSVKRGTDFWLGTMIEVPRAVITADEIAPEVDFMSFGTNDLTQMGCGFSRDDAGSFLGRYVEEGIYDRDPFQTIDQKGIGKLMQICVEKARSVNPDMEFGICGEHGGDPESVKFCHRIGLNDVSCSPYRVPIAKLAAAQAAIEDEK